MTTPRGGEYGPSAPLATQVSCACGSFEMPSFGKRYISGRHGRMSSVRYIEEDRGYVTPCCLWQGAKSVQCYGTVETTQGIRLAHRVVYERERGPIPAGLRLPRFCGVHACVNSVHGEPVTRAEEPNRHILPSSQAHHAGVCLKRHLMTPENTVTTKRGSRLCRTCKNDQQRA